MKHGVMGDAQFGLWGLVVVGVPVDVWWGQVWWLIGAGRRCGDALGPQLVGWLPFAGPSERCEARRSGNLGTCG